MYLEKIEIQGFKSFAKKTTLKFTDGKKTTENNIGLTVIVGPNGSGKSNIADAVRWVLGEQSTKLLRGKKGEDVIFSGSSKKASLSFAEVSLHLNNQSKRAPIDFTELIITRRLYRDGEGEYLINGSKVRLLDVSLLLAKAKFSQRAYSVVGQGMIDSFLNTSPAERKEFFDEATGVKVFQIKKNEANNKLKNASGNLEQAEQLLVEIEPRLKSLTRQIKKLQQRTELEKDLHGLQKNYYARSWHVLNNELQDINKRVVRYEDQQRDANSDLNKINEQLKNLQQLSVHNDPSDPSDKHGINKHEAITKDLKHNQHKRNELGQELAEVRAQRNVALQQSGQTDVDWLSEKSRDIQTDLTRLQKELIIIEDKFTTSNKEVVRVRKDQNEVDKKILNVRRRMIDSNEANDSSEMLADLNTIIDEFGVLNDNINRALIAEDISALKKYFSRLEKKISELKNVNKSSTTKSDDDLENLNSEITTLEEEKKKLTESYIQHQGEVNNLRSSIDITKTSIDNSEIELKEINKKLKERSEDVTVDTSGLDRQQTELEHKLKSIDSAIDAAEKSLKALYESEKKQRDSVIVMQKKSHELQNEYNAVLVKLNEVRVKKARIETKLEDVEREIREEMSSLRTVIDNKKYNDGNDESDRESIQKIKRQLELIGGIDPEIAKEYTDTKERFDFLSTQSKDLDKAITSLKKVISKLDETIATRFATAFTEINQHFEKYFKVLFGGGSAKLEKIYEEESKQDKNEDEVVEDDDIEVPEIQEKKKVKVELRKTKKVLTGIDVSATPPNKKIKSISVLSGGERALTSIALISAIIAVNPSPFVMLDEVDAALDEANSLRLARILEDLSKKSQFIAITHNRTIMYKADIIYGVTMGDDGVSKLLSVKIDDVKGARR